ncbi:hypothetical protein OIE66_08775 [Nonomuraea sp. NBC_01738]|uniref:hypothetical protein n=1 Tax=Nonomuraea sp. NBC_01738 TaxID=2976003 RepID=UPI002E0EEB04|nr:hypothetical protein OIE66_08775 [Nonomuraea sp. NBC_01738]
MSRQPRAWVWFAAIAAVILVPTAVAWPLGGLADAESPQPKRLALGQGVTGHRLELVPRRLFHTTTEPDAVGDPDKGDYLVLEADVTNVSKRPADLAAVYSVLAITLDGKPLDPIMDLHRQTKLSGGQVLNPGLPEKIRISWAIPATIKDPGRAGIAIKDEEYLPSYSLLGYASGTSLWYRGEIMATLDTPLERA